MDFSLAFLLGCVIAGIIALNLSTRNLCRKEFKILHSKLDAILESRDFAYPPLDLVSAHIKELIMSGKEKEALNLLLEEYQCSSVMADKFIVNFKRSITAADGETE